MIVLIPAVFTAITAIVAIFSPQVPDMATYSEYFLYFLAVLGVLTSIGAIGQMKQIAGLEHDRSEAKRLRQELININQLVSEKENKIRQGQTRLNDVQADLDTKISGNRTLSQKLEDLEKENSSLVIAHRDMETKLKKHQENQPKESDDQGGTDIIYFLSLLQQRGRFIDFVMGDITKYQDAQVGAAARIVHQGLSGVLKDFFKIEPIHNGNEGEAVKLDDDYNARQYRIIGDIDKKPYKGKLLHKGWQTSTIKLPKQIDQNKRDHSVIAPCEVELT